MNIRQEKVDQASRIVASDKNYIEGVSITEPNTRDVVSINLRMEVRNIFEAEGQVIGLKKKVWKYKEIVRKLLNEQPLTADEKTFLKKEEVTAKKG